MKLAFIFFGLLLYQISLVGFGFYVGDAHGYMRANGEQAARWEEHDRIMQYVGVCKWAKIMADDMRCKTELP